MKPVKNFVFAVLLLSLLAINTVAGDMQTPGAASPPPPPPEHAMSTDGETSPCLGDSYSEQSGETAETSDYLLLEAIAALLSVY